MEKLFLMIMAAVALMTGCTSKESKQTEKEQTTMETAKDTFVLSAEERAQNMQEVHDYVRACGYYTIATVDGDQPRVRAFNSFEIINGRLYVMTGKKKDVYKQLDKNGKFELIAVKRDFSEWIRVSGVLVDDPDVEPQKEYLKRNPQFANSYQPGDGNMAMLYITNATARISSFTGKPERIFIF